MPSPREAEDERYAQIRAPGEFLIFFAAHLLSGKTLDEEAPAKHRVEFMIISKAASYIGKLGIMKIADVEILIADASKRSEMIAPCYKKAVAHARFEFIKSAKMVVAAVAEEIRHPCIESEIDAIRFVVIKDQAVE